MILLNDWRLMRLPRATTFKSGSYSDRGCLVFGLAHQRVKTNHGLCRAIRFVNAHQRLSASLGHSEYAKSACIQLAIDAAMPLNRRVTVNRY